MVSYDKITHLNFIQNTIKRMAENSLACKTWTITIFSALTVLFMSLKREFSDNFVFFIVIAAMILVFWVLDAWYLWMERLFRRLYDHIRRTDDAQVEDPYSMSFKCFIKEEQCVLRIMFSKSTCLFYFPLILILSLILLKLNRG